MRPTIAPSAPPSFARSTHPGLRVLAVAVLAAALAAGGLAGCSEDPSGPPEGGGQTIDGYLQALEYDPDAMLNVQDTGSQDRLQTQLGDPQVSTEMSPVGEMHCVRTQYSLQQNSDKLAILRPTQGIVWPGALVKGNQSLTDGLPEPVTLARAPVTLSIDLPGMGEHGVVVVDNPSQSSIQAAIDGALEWWNANAYQDGYVNAASSSFQWTSSYSNEQTGLAVGLNLGWASGEVSSAFSTSTTTSKHVVTGAFQQAFYTVTFDTPATPAAVFGAGVTLAAVRGQCDAANPPAYIANVTYGRIIAVRMETTSTETTERIEGAFKYSAGVQQASGDLETRYKEILQQSTFTVLTLGGNAAVATDVLTGPLDSFQGMLAAIRGENAIYSRSNPGVPISYTVRFLADHSLARLGASTEYTATECTLNSAVVTLKYVGMKVLGDCRLFEGYFYWELGATVGGARTNFAVRTSNQAVLGDDVAGTYLGVNIQRTFTIPKTPNATITLAGDVHEKLSGTDLPHLQAVHSVMNPLSTTSYSRTLSTVAGISSCSVRVDYQLTIQ